MSLIILIVMLIGMAIIVGWEECNWDYLIGIIIFFLFAAFIGIIGGN